ncbi:TonB-dependent receptor [Methylomarinum sp. Ch1-1]|uniref:TonB-dependent receptor n=1 Tax=Methylomarinum roseum TaxID=3067653 RepID=A0AAU7NVJ4_9GAMM|nr:TonB-dependent receptor [Methylomarinum sp. Ch1-1]MDP4522997.1 TonB-dependent receptor [Methylomarinum sp. Ch1-1]
MHKFVYSSLLLAGLNPATADESVNLPNYVVTATRTDTPVNQLSAATVTYTRADIEQYQVNSLPELLQRATGIDMVQNGGMGKNTSIFMRGTNSDHVLVLIDGIKVGSVTTGTTPFQYLPIDQIERVEIIRGPHSSLYGSEAIGGVIQIFTRQGKQQEKPNITLDAGGGNYATLETSGSISGKWRNAWYSLSASHINTQGFDARKPTTGFFAIDHPDDDGYYNTGLNAKLGYRFDNNAEVEAFYMRSEGRTDFDGTPDKTEFVNQLVGLSGALDITDIWHATFRLGQSRDDNDNFAPDGSFYSHFDSTRWNASWLNELQLAEDHQLIIGADYRFDEVDSSTHFTETERYDAGVFAELHSRLFDRHYLNASVRWDENEAFGDYVTGSFGWRFNWNHGLSAFASFGNAFKAPTFNELFWPDTGFGGGNPNLQPEESTTFEVGLAGNHDWLTWEVRAYHTNIDNLIASWPPQNIDKAQIDGIETDIGAEIFGWHNKVGFQLLSPKDRITNKRLPRRAEKILNYDLSRSFDALDVGATILARGDSFDDTRNNTKIHGFVTVALRAAYHFNQNWRVSAKLNNLLDKQYQLTDTYNTADRNFFVSIHYNN